MGMDSREGERRFEFVMGFSDVEKLGGEPSTVGEYKSQGLTGAEPGKYAVNNGTIAMVTSDGRINVWIPKADPKAPRAVSFDQALKALASAGYTEGNFYVPNSNR